MVHVGQVPHARKEKRAEEGPCDRAGRPGPPVGRPPRAAGTTAVEDRIDALARDGGPGRIRNVLAELDLIKGHLDAGAAEIVRRRLAELLGTFAPTAPASARLQARLEGEPYDAHCIEMLQNLAEGLAALPPQPAPALGASGASLIRRRRHPLGAAAS